MAASNRMVEKSRTAVKTALLELIYVKDFKEITVSELIEKANISRGTFYAHFSNLDDVRQQLISDYYTTADEFMSGYTTTELARDPYPVLLIVADAIYQSRDPAKRLFKFINVYDLGSELKPWLVNFLLSDGAFVERFGGYEKALHYCRYISGGVMHAFGMCIKNDFSTSPEEFARLMADIIIQGVNTLLKPE